MQTPCPPLQAKSNTKHCLHRIPERKKRIIRCVLSRRKKKGQFHLFRKIKSQKDNPMSLFFFMFQVFFSSLLDEGKTPSVKKEQQPNWLAAGTNLSSQCTLTLALSFPPRSGEGWFGFFFFRIPSHFPNFTATKHNCLC